ncbi:MAG: hypothetical protein UX39_C0015G0012 [Candidatus Magasanikbacteria bacterium GW2011_GWA2_46_17]|uniref:Uncharacterized protein n=1 Tax=Candidatus Magasanikbacteria bacterium GW2011_GWA2_46_17 TaxID=1619042 RepID=A0A0G1NZ27_9BACT|nr:MAG: hypothetical protein UX39_C0015G0012 [Candidatus Magasanikbacteria bacterium GW2011_GWA2_46_17]
MPAKPKLLRRTKLADLDSEYRAAFERNISWKRICEMFELSHRDPVDDEDGADVVCPHCDLDSTETIVSLSSTDKVFECPECGMKDTKLDFVVGCFSRDPTVSNTLKLFGDHCFD